MPFTKRISIERYKGEVAEDCAGLIEGETEDGNRWIIYMDANGKPQVYWPERSPDGGVVGEGIPLDKGELGAILRNLKVDSAEEVISCFPIWQYDNQAPQSRDYGMRGIVFAVVPGEGSHDEKMARFLLALGNAYPYQGSTPQSRMAKLRQILESSDDPAAVVQRLWEAVHAAEEHNKPIE